MREGKRGFMLAQTLMDTLNADQLQFNDSASCKRWIALLPLTNVESSQLALTWQVSRVRQAVLAPLELLRVLEALREPAAYVQYELARKYAGKPQPLDAAEAACWARVLRLWQEFIAAYTLCRDAHARGDPGVKNHGALIVMRCLRYTAGAMFEHYRAYRQVPGELWKQLHQHYAFAEQGGFARTLVVDAFSQQEAASSCATAYRQALLVQLANPFALSGQQLEVLARWSANWAGLVNLTSEPLPPSASPALVVDLAGNSGPVFATGLEPRAGLRYLDREPLGRTLRQVIALLKQGQTPAQLDLGANARQPGCGNLLMLLYIQWCRAGTDRGEQRAPTAENAQVCLGMHAAHFYISGRSFRSPGAGLSRQQEHDLQLFGHISERTERALASNENSAAESWQLLNQSNSGFMCMLREPDAQLRIGHYQLVAVRRGSSKSFYLGLVQWLRIEENNELLVGIRLFSGIARAVAVRPDNFNAPSAIKDFERALWLPEMATPTTPATLILPSGWYQAGRCVELHGDRKQVVTLVNLLEKGSDFERCTFTFDQNL